MNHALYLASQFDENTYKTLFTAPKKPMQAAGKYHRLLCEGLAANGVSLCAYSVLPINRANYGGLVAKAPKVTAKGVRLVYPLIVNQPVVKHLFLFTQAFFKTLFAPRKTVLFYDCLVIAASYGACFAAKLRRFPCLSIVTDLPEFMGIAESKMGKKINDMLLDLADGFLFLTQQMNEKVNRRNRPYLVMEGHIDQETANLEHRSFTEAPKRVLYAGGLQPEYGIKNLCEAFLQIAKENEELHIYGDGGYREELESLCRSNENVIYHGNVLNSVVVEAELDAALLVNPRPAEGEFTKYSFPSKTMEYMASGTPVAMTCLPGMPPEYRDYVDLFASGAVADIAAKLREILDRSPMALQEQGQRAKEFVLREKTNIKQAAKALQFIETQGW